MHRLLFLGLILNTVLVFGQKQNVLDVQKIVGTVKLMPSDQSLEGSLKLTFTVNQQTDSIFLDAVDMTAQINPDYGVQLKTRKNKIWFYGSFQPHTVYTFDFSYRAKPQKAMYFKGWHDAGTNQVWTQGQGKETAHWLPSLNDATDKIEFDLSYNVPNNYRVIANGALTDTIEQGGRQTWTFNMNHPMSSYLVAVAVGNYVKKENMVEDTPLQFFLQPADNDHFEPTYRYSTDIFKFLEEKIGVDYPWQNYKQVPVRDFLYAGMENTTATIFSDRFVIDSTAFIDRNYVNVNAHELAHQWFGDYVTAASSKHHWLQEGFATFYSLLAQREVFGSDFFYFQLIQNAEQLKNLSDRGDGNALLNANADSFTFYQKGAWALFALRKKIGKEAFRQGIQNYLKTYAFSTATTTDFLNEMEQASSTDLSHYRQVWLEQVAFPSKEAIALVKDNAFVKKLLRAKAFRNIPLNQKREALTQMLQFPVNEFIGQEVVHQLGAENPNDVIDLYKKAFSSHNILVRQAIAENIQQVPKALKADFESLLDDPSYFTQEKALMALWQSFPENRNQYLTTMEGLEGFSNKNVRLLWLTLSLVTREFKIDKSQEFYSELSGYTQPRYPYELRQNAFSYLYQINSFTSKNYKDLLDSTNHPVWRFAKFAQQLLDKLMQDPERRKELMLLKPDLSERFQKKIERAIKKS